MAADNSWLGAALREDANEVTNVWISNTFQAHSLSDGEEDLRDIALPAYIRATVWICCAAKKRRASNMCTFPLPRLNLFEIGRRFCHTSRSLGVALCSLSLQNEFGIAHFGGDFARLKRDALPVLFVSCPRGAADL